MKKRDEASIAHKWARADRAYKREMIEFCKGLVTEILTNSDAEVGYYNMCNYIISKMQSNPELLNDLQDNRYMDMPYDAVYTAMNEMVRDGLIIKVTANRKNGLWFSVYLNPLSALSRAATEKHR